jgi:hypothetical protein
MFFSLNASSVSPFAYFMPIFAAVRMNHCTALLGYSKECDCDRIYKAELIIAIAVGGVVDNAGC